MEVNFCGEECEKWKNEMMKKERSVSFMAEMEMSRGRRELSTNEASAPLPNLTTVVYDKTTVGETAGGVVEVGNAIREMTDVGEGDGACDEIVACVGEGVAEA
ncbi:hypothetical protein M5K25_003469 [Dendrobium thyrsiflorum]|uniref:Uncharacterized protein n=1 Tax=Dendrobium thyrsiflorum TaxID=117978 RepID=A0ABD0VK14_DENTH